MSIVEDGWPAVEDAWSILKDAWLIMENVPSVVEDALSVEVLNFLSIYYIIRYMYMQYIPADNQWDIVIIISPNKYHLLNGHIKYVAAIW